METLLLDAARPEALEHAAQLLRAGRLVAFPTETVYGLGARGLDPDAVERIFIAKGRPHSDPVILHVADATWVRELVRETPPLLATLAEAFWPGPLTVVLPRSARVPDLVTAGMDSVAVRVPAHPVALELIRRVGEPIAAPSANLFGRTSPTVAHHVLQDLAGRIDAVLDGGSTTVGVESTVLDLCGEQPAILRPGGITREALEAVLGCAVYLRGAAAGDDTAPQRSPGLLTRHYSPRAEVLLYDGPDAAVYSAVRRVARESDPRTTALLLFSEDLEPLRDLAGERVDLGSRADPAQAAHALYAAFRDLDARGIRRILVRTAPPAGLGAALNDRLTRAASGRVHRPGADGNAA